MRRVLAAAAVTTLAVAVLVFVPDLRAHLAIDFACWSVIAACMITVGLRWSRWDIDARRGARVLIVSGVAFRLIALAMAPSLSGDVWRYAWDGRVLATGHNPYAYTPADSALAPLRDEAYGHGEYADYHSIYPPLAELVFGACALVSHVAAADSPRATILLWKILLVAAETGTLLLLARMLRRRARGIGPLVWYAWHPLPIVEFAGQGHTDALLVLGIVAMLDALERGARVRAATAYAWSLLTRGVSLMFLPAIGRDLGWRRVLFALAALAAFSLPFASAAAVGGAVQSLRAMGGTFVFNAAGFWVLYGMCEAAHWWSAEPYLTMVLGTSFVCALVMLRARAADERTPEGRIRALLAVCAAAAVLLWNMHPWYFSWGLPLAVLTPSPAWLWLTVVSHFTYIHYTPDSNTWLLLAAIAEYGGFLGLLAWQRWGIDGRTARA